MKPEMDDIVYAGMKISVKEKSKYKLTKLTYSIYPRN